MKRFLFFIILIIALIAIAACSPGAQDTNVLPTDEATSAVQQETSEPETPIKIRINSNPYFSSAPIMIAQAEGFFVEQNLDVEFVDIEIATTLPLLLSGDLDIFSAAHNTGLMNSVRVDPNVKVVADRGFVDPDGCTYVALLLQRDLYNSGTYTEPESLVGLTFANNAGGYGAFFADALLKPVGFDTSTLTLNYLPNGSLIDAFDNGAIDAVVIGEPWLTRLNQAGVTYTWKTGEEVIPNFEVSVMAFGSTILRDNPEAGIRFMVAYLKGVQQYREGKTDRNLDILAEQTGMTHEELKTICWPSIRADARIDFSGLDAYQNWAMESGFLDERLTEKEYWTSYFIDEALARLNP